MTVRVGNHAQGVALSGQKLDSGHFAHRYIHAYTARGISLFFVVNAGNDQNNKNNYTQRAQKNMQNKMLLKRISSVLDRLWQKRNNKKQHVQQ